ncbi:VOC family protein [Streptomyces sp. NPDC046275]|uniref:VOC family protein n=1 Tax=Streptomyces sp. NPDC046275 TaxID=3157201 RepID=UPI0033D49BA4
MATLRKIQVTIDCAEPRRLAAFWCEVLGYVLPAPPEGFASWEEFEASGPSEDETRYFACSDPTGAGPRVLFQRVPESKVVKNRVHLDVRAGTGLVGDERLAVLQAERERLEALGGKCVDVLYADGVNESCIVMQDPEGNEFCLD